MVVLPSNHRLAALKAISPKDLVGEAFVIASRPNSNFRPSTFFHDTV